MEIINTLAENYAKQYTSALDTLLSEVEDHTLRQHAHAHMLSGHTQGKFLQMLSCMIKPKTILEVGTFTGFSALCLAKGLTENGELHTIEVREDDAAKAKTFFEKSNPKNIHIHVGNALEIIPTLNYTWDLVFLDADKTNYVNYYELILPKLNIGAFILADNVLFHGEVLQQNITGKNALAIDAFNKHVANDDRVEQVMVTIRDGISIIKKIKN